MILARVLTILLGAVPASVLSVWALFGLLIGASVVLEGEWSSAIFVVWGFAGICGAVALWAVGFGCDEAGCMLGLAIGVTAILPFAVRIDPHRMFHGGEIDLAAAACLAPLVIGVAWLLAFLAACVRDRLRVLRRTEADKRWKGR